MKILILKSIAMEWSLVGGVAISTLGYIFGRKVTNAEATKKLEEATKLKAETNTINILNLQSIVDSYKAKVDDVEGQLQRDKTSYRLMIVTFENHTSALEKQIKAIETESTQIKRKNNLLEKENRTLKLQFKRKYSLLELQVNELTKRNTYLEQELLTLKK